MRLLLFTLILTCSLATATTNKSEILVYVVDTGLSKEVKSFKNFLSSKNKEEDLVDVHGHGTHVTGLILFGKDLKTPVCKEVKVVMCRWFYPESKTSTADCFRRARLVNADFVNFSGGGPQYSKTEHRELQLLSKKSIIVIAAGNSNLDLSKDTYYPASLKLQNTYVVGNGNSDQDRCRVSNYGLDNMEWVDGRNVVSYSPNGNLRVLNGTSQAAALKTHALLQRECQRLRSSR